MHKSLKKLQRRFTKYERSEYRKEQLRMAMHGEGKYLFQNNTRGSLELPKPPLEGSKIIPPNGKFLGDNYFMQMVRTNDLKLLEEIEKPMSEKLITEQPPVVTAGGTVEFVQQPAGLKKLNETPTEAKPQQDVLINEDPLGGVVILD